MDYLISYIRYKNSRDVIHISTNYLVEGMYETAVFSINDKKRDWDEIDSRWHESEKEAEKGHDKIVLEYKKDGTVMSEEEYRNWSNKV